jgi:hypothetical protein
MDRIINEPKNNEENLQIKIVHKTVKEDLEETGETDWTYRF